MPVKKPAYIIDALDNKTLDIRKAVIGLKSALSQARKELSQLYLCLDYFKDDSRAIALKLRAERVLLISSVTPSELKYSLIHTDSNAWHECLLPTVDRCLTEAIEAIERIDAYLRLKRTENNKQ